MINMPFSRFTDYFIAVAKHGSFRKASEELYISVSAVHRQISLAEDDMGILLFERLSTGLKLTLAGELLYADLMRWQKDFQQTKIRFDEIQGLKRGSIEFGLIAALSEGFIIDVLASLYQQYPWINFNICMNDSEVIAQKIMNTELDFGLILNPKAHNHLEVVSFLEIPIGFVLAHDHPLSKQEKIFFSDTIEYHHLIPSAPLIIHDYASSLYKHHAFIPRVKTECNDIRMITAILKKSPGIGILSYLDAYPMLQRQELVFVPIQEKGLHSLTIALCVAPKRQMSRMSQIMMNQLTQKMEQLNTIIQTAL